MPLTKAASAIVTHDLRRMSRDRFLLMSAVYIAGLCVALRWIVPWLHDAVLRTNGFDITPFVHLGTSYFAVVNTSVLVGLLYGFLLLEVREERVIRALLVAQVPVSTHLAVTGALWWLASVLIVLGEALLMGVGVPTTDALLACALVGAPAGVVNALILSSFAANKVEAFAVLKSVAFLGVLPVGAWFVPEPWQWLAGATPLYWPSRIWWEGCTGGSGWAWMVPVGLVVSAIWVAALGRRFQHAVRSASE